MACLNNLKQIALALHAYHDTYGEFPPACIRDENGRPLHSWRVLILPFVEQQPLYDQYRFDEPWDGPHNRQLADKMPNVFRCPSYVHHQEHQNWWTGDEQTLTQYTALVGAATILQPDRSASLDEIAGSTREATLVAELHPASVPWMAPDDLSPGEFVLALDDKSKKNQDHPGGTHLALADGSVRFVAETTDREQLWELLTMPSRKQPGLD